ncbi:unnamed protein product [Closterium sp. NIES-64]|nr:unnamed protein product [Closterium sp. NIES-64]
MTSAFTHAPATPPSNPPMGSPASPQMDPPTSPAPSSVALLPVAPSAPYPTVALLVALPPPLPVPPPSSPPVVVFAYGAGSLWGGRGWVREEGQGVAAERCGGEGSGGRAWQDCQQLQRQRHRQKRPRQQLLRQQRPRQQLYRQQKPRQQLQLPPPPLAHSRVSVREDRVREMIKALEATPERLFLLLDMAAVVDELMPQPEQPFLLLDMAATVDEIMPQVERLVCWPDSEGLMAEWQGLTRGEAKAVLGTFDALTAMLQVPVEQPRRNKWNVGWIELGRGREGDKQYWECGCSEERAAAAARRAGEGGGTVEKSGSVHAVTSYVINYIATYLCKCVLQTLNHHTCVCPMCPSCASSPPYVPHPRPMCLIPAPCASSPPYVPHSRLMCLIPASCASSPPHVPHPRPMCLIPAPCASSPPHVPHACLMCLMPASCASCLPHVPHACLICLMPASCVLRCHTAMAHACRHQLCCQFRCHLPGQMGACMACAMHPPTRPYVCLVMSATSSRAYGYGTMLEKLLELLTTARQRA